MVNVYFRKHFPDLPADFAIGQYYGMTLELEQLSNNSMVRQKNFIRQLVFDARSPDLYSLATFPTLIFLSIYS